ncbi:MAG: hypothetical protein JO269_11045 [Burkholderiaceae bacterium]|nr:hypothetical protein [Burkholderiaceae bacterium]
MSGRIVKLRATPHQATQELLAWFTLDRLRRDERMLVQEHLQTCAQCRADVDFLFRLQAAELPEPSFDSALDATNPAVESCVPDVERALAKLRPRLQPHGGGSRGLPPVIWRIVNSLRGTSAGGAPWMRWTLGVQLAAIAGLCALLARPLWQAPPPADLHEFRGLGANAASAHEVADIVVVFKPQTSEQELRRILLSNGAHVVDGPTVTDAYLLKVAPGRRQQTLAQLRSEAAVTLAESLVASAESQ